jgi:GntR family transcriptional regulator, carbon starvation induced regulator
VDQQHGRALPARNRDFHQALESACGSPLLLEFGHKAFSRSERYRRHFVDYTRLLPNANSEHRDMMQAALARRADDACALLRDHILSNVQIVRECMEQRMRQASATHPSPRRQR